MEEQIIENISQVVKDALAQEGSGHDFWHIERVRKMAKRIAESEGADSFICQVAALVHDLIDDKIVASEEEGKAMVQSLLQKEGLSTEQIAMVMEIITKMSYKGGAVRYELTIEGQVVQDADRLDAIGAIGVARTFAFSGNKNRLIHDPEVEIREDMTLEEYRSNKGTAITHFYEKLLKLKGLMNTDTAKELAEKRHAFLESFLEQFYAEWDSER